MAEIGGRPFLHYLLAELGRQEFRDVVLCVGHGADQIREYFGSGADRGMRLRYSVEAQPLGTAGALKLAEPLINTERALLVNGDLYLGADYSPLFDATAGKRATCVIAMHRTVEQERFGTVALDDHGRITSFIEKDSSSAKGDALINAGVYAFDRSLLDEIPAGIAASLERDVLPKLAREGRLYGRELLGKFIDMGIPDDYLRLKRNWRDLFGSLVAE